MTPRQPNYNSEAETLVGGEPDALVIIDFPETYAKVGPALVRAGFDPKKTFVTDGLTPAISPRAPVATPSRASGAPLRARPTRARPPSVRQAVCRRGAH